MNKVELKDRVDWEFIRELEGFESKGYIPKDNEKIDKTPSGVTIAGGFDLGQQSKRSLIKFGFSPSLLKKLEPYIGITGIKARSLLKTKPLSLTDPELDELDFKVRARYYEAVRIEFDTSSKTKLQALDSAKQTVIVSVGFQYGSIKHRCPKFFGLITENLWEGAVKELENFGDAYKKRRLKEAKLLKSSLR